MIAVTLNALFSLKACMAFKYAFHGRLSNTLCVEPTFAPITSNLQINKGRIRLAYKYVLVNKGCTPIL